MTRLLAILGTACVLMSMNAPAEGADFTFQFVNDGERELSLKLFSRAGTYKEWPSKTRTYQVRPGAAVQEVKIDCTEGERICWGAWVTVQGVTGQVGGSGQRDLRTTTWEVGAGQRGMHECTDCCHVCKAGGKAEVGKLDEPDRAAR